MLYSSAESGRAITHPLITQVSVPRLDPTDVLLNEVWSFDEGNGRNLLAIQSDLEACTLERYVSLQTGEGAGGVLGNGAMCEWRARDQARGWMESFRYKI